MIVDRFPPLLPLLELVQGRCLVIAPHADDEVIACGGLLALARGAGIEVRVLHLSDGANGDPQGRYEDIVALRREEARRALDALGVEPAFDLALRDGTLASQGERLREGIAEQLAAFSPRHLIAPSPFEAHRDHLAAAMAVRNVLEGPEGAELHTLLLYGVNAPVPANALVDTTAAMDLKDRAMACYASQIAYNDIRTKVRSLDAARTVNVDLPAVCACEAFARLRPAGAEALFRLAAELDQVLF